MENEKNNHEKKEKKSWWNEHNETVVMTILWILCILLSPVFIALIALYIGLHLVIRLPFMIWSILMLPVGILMILAPVKNTSRLYNHPLLNLLTPPVCGLVAMFRNVPKEERKQIAKAVQWETRGPWKPHSIESYVTDTNQSAWSANLQYKNHVSMIAGLSYFKAISRLPDVL